MAQSGEVIQEAVRLRGAILHRLRIVHVGAKDHTRIQFGDNARVLNQDLRAALLTG